MFGKTILFGLLFSVFISCEHATEDVHNTQETNLIPQGIKQLRSLNYPVEEIGRYHNEVLGEFMNKNKKYEFTSFENLLIDLKETSQNLYGQKYHDLIAIDEEYQLKSSSLTLTNKGNNTFSEMIKESYTGMVSFNVQEALDYIVENELTYESTHEYLKGYLSNNNKLSDIDKEILHAFDVFTSYSDEYWADYPSNKIKGKAVHAKGCTPRSQQYLADGFGFLLGGGLGALGYSAAIHILQDEGSHCI
ncbi:MAG: hypothetical protein NXH86_03275 [Flavobacteriaceae bacterium]|nr:hypothetical protein [Flavobacteriaceae bacterium]